jgi:hypothetical protein
MIGRCRLRAELLAPLLADLAAQERSGEMPIRGTSMKPSLLHGDRAQIVPTSTKESRIGDIVLRLGDTGPMIHRVVGWWWTRDGWQMLTKGDGARWLDPPLDPDQLVGRVVAQVRNGKVWRLDGIGARLCGRGRAAVSLAAGIMWEVWMRSGQAARRWLGPPGD